MFYLLLLKENITKKDKKDKKKIKFVASKNNKKYKVKII